MTPGSKAEKLSIPLAHTIPRAALAPPLQYKHRLLPIPSRHRPRNSLSRTIAPPEHARVHLMAAQHLGPLVKHAPAAAVLGAGLDGGAEIDGASVHALILVRDPGALCGVSSQHGITRAPCSFKRPSLMLILMRLRSSLRLVLWSLGGKSIAESKDEQLTVTSYVQRVSGESPAPRQTQSYRYPVLPPRLPLLTCLSALLF